MYFVFKKANEDLYWSALFDSWVVYSKATVYTAQQVQDIESIGGVIGGYWQKIVSEPVELAEGVR
jgi:hypothetical protein